MQLHEAIDEIRATGAEFWAIANDDTDKLRAYREEEGFEFPFLLDPDAEAIKAWGLLNEADSDSLIPHPAVVILDVDGIVRYLFVETNYRLRPPVAEVIERLQLATQ